MSLVICFSVQFCKISMPGYVYLTLHSCPCRLPSVTNKNKHTHVMFHTFLLKRHCIYYCITLKNPGVILTLCCFVVYSTMRFVLCLTLCYFVLVFFCPFSIAVTSLGKERANLSAFRTFVRFALG